MASRVRSNKNGDRIGANLTWPCHNTFVLSHQQTIVFLSSTYVWFLTSTDRTCIIASNQLVAYLKQEFLIQFSVRFPCDVQSTEVNRTIWVLRRESSAVIVPVKGPIDSSICKSGPISYSQSSAAIIPEERTIYLEQWTLIAIVVPERDQLIVFSIASDIQVSSSSAWRRKQKNPIHCLNPLTEKSKIPVIFLANIY